MSINYTTLFTRIGKCIKVSNDLITLQGTYAGVGAQADDILDEYEDRRDLVDGLLQSFDGVATNLSGQVSRLKQAVDATLVDLRTDLNVPTSNVADVLGRLYEDMVANTQTVDANTASAPTIAAVAGNTGSGSLVASVTDNLGRNAEASIDEVVRFVCDTDGYGGGTFGAEQFTVTGYPTLDPQKYGTRGNGNGSTLTVLDGGDNLLSGGGFDVFTVANTPDDWTIDTGTAGTNIFSEASTIHAAGGKALKLQGNGALATATLGQNLDPLSPLTRYVAGVWLRKGAGTFASGSLLTIRLYNKTTSALVGSNVYSADPATLTTSYVLWSVFFNTTETPPLTTDDLEFQITWTTAGGVASTGQIFIDDLAFGEPYLFGGVYYAIFRGAAHFTIADAFTSTTDNNFAGTFQTYFGRFYDGYQLPSDNAASETISDSLAE